MDDSVFHRLYESYHQDVFQFLIYLVKDRPPGRGSDARGISKGCLSRIAVLQGTSSEKTWLFSIAKNVAIDFFRKNTVRKKHVSESFDWETQQLTSATSSPEELTELNDEMRQVLEALDQCTGDQKMVIVMRYFQELSILETAEVLKWTEGKVKTTQHRAIKSIREHLSHLKQEVKAHGES